MLNRFDFGNNTLFQHHNFFSEQNAVHQRYHKAPKSTKAKISAIFRQKILDMMSVKKHELVRRDAKEREKLETIEYDLSNNRRLILVPDPASLKYEDFSNTDFNLSIT